MVVEGNLMVVEGDQWLLREIDGFRGGSMVVEGKLMVI
jgi:hypothetical protein